MFYVGLKWLTTDWHYSNNFALVSSFLTHVFIIPFYNVSEMCRKKHTCETQKSNISSLPATNMLGCWIQKLNLDSASGHGQDDSTKLNPSCSKTIWVMIQCDKLVEFSPWGLKGTSSWLRSGARCGSGRKHNYSQTKKVNMHHDRFPAEPPPFLIVFERSYPFFNNWFVFFRVWIPKKSTRRFLVE